MDAAYKYLNKTVLFLATALLLVVPGRAQTFVLAGGGNTASVSVASGATGVAVASSDGTTAIAFTTGTAYTGTNQPGPNWLGVTGTMNTGTTGTTLYFSVVQTAGMVLGQTYTAVVTLTSASPAITGTINVSYSYGSTTGGGTLTLGTLNNFTYTQNGTAPAAQTLSVSASTSTYYTATAASADNWLQISATSGYTNSSLTVSAIQSVLSGLTVGTHSGTITLSANGIQQTINVTLVVSASTTGGSGNVTVSPTSMTFGPYQVGGTAPAAQYLQVTSASGSASVSFTISSNAAWLSTGVQNGASVNTPYNNPGFTISIVNPSSLTPSSTPYTGVITISPTGGTVISVPVSFTVQAAPAVSVTSSTTLSFQYKVGGASPSSQTVTVSGGGASVGFTAAVTSGSDWLSVSPASGTTPTTGTAALTVTATPGTKSAGTYPGAILVSGTGGAGGSITINASLVVTAPLPTINSVVNAASFIRGLISPGEIVTLFGTDIGPVAAAYASVDPQTGKLATNIGGVQVLFNGIAAPMIYAGNQQVSAIVPYEMAPISSPSVWIRYLGQDSNGYPLTSATTMPGIFTQNSQGSGPGSILNQDFSTNGPGNPAAKGSTVMVYMTGEGQTSCGTPGLCNVTGKITTPTLPPPQVTPAPLLPIGVLINGQPALWTYAGEAPGFAAGLMQLNVQIPPNAPSGNLSITVSIGSNISQNNVTVSVR